MPKTSSKRRLEVERALRDRRTIIVLDNMESVLPDPATGGDDATIKEIFKLCADLLNAAGATRLIFTSREPLPEPFAHSHRTAELRELDDNDAIELVSQVMKSEGLEPKHDDAGNAPRGDH